MTEELYRRMSKEHVSPAIALRRHKRMAVLAVLAAAAVGAGSALLLPTDYMAETRLAVGGNDLAAQAVPGFALASQEMAANYARYVNNAQEQSALESDLGVRAGTVEEVSASPIPQSNVVRIEVTARTPEAAVSAAAAVAESLMDRVNDRSGADDEAEATLAEHAELSDQVAAAQQASDAAEDAVDNAAPGANLTQLREVAASAAAQVAVLKVQQEALGQKYRAQIAATAEVAANLSVVQEAALSHDNLLARLQQFGLAGAALGAVLALLFAVRLERRRAVRPGEAAEDRVPGAGGSRDRSLNGSVAVAGERVD
jgi:capsular polysaccharide biosynthesis protein